MVCWQDKQVLFSFGEHTSLRWAQTLVTNVSWHLSNWLRTSTDGRRCTEHKVNCMPHCGDTGNRAKAACCSSDHISCPSTWSESSLRIPATTLPLILHWRAARRGKERRKWEPVPSFTGTSSLFICYNVFPGISCF